MVKYMVKVHYKLAHFGGWFWNFYHKQNHQVRYSIKDAVNKHKIVNINPLDCIISEIKNINDTEYYANQIASCFDEVLYNSDIPHVLEYGCGMIILNGHHRIMATVIIGKTTIPVMLSRFKLIEVDLC